METVTDIFADLLRSPHGVVVVQNGTHKAAVVLMSMMHSGLITPPPGLAFGTHPRPARRSVRGEKVSKRQRDRAKRERLRSSA